MTNYASITKGSLGLLIVANWCMHELTNQDGRVRVRVCLEFSTCLFATVNNSLPNDFLVYLL
jgi:hypothetical protein